MINAAAPPSGEIEKQKIKSGWTLKIHPLFLALGAYYALTGELFLFFISTLVAVQHELAHAYAAERLGYKLHRLLLMPYGAVIDGDLSACSVRDEISVAIAGPLCNLFTSALFVALWWLYPRTYPYTDVACYISFWTAIVNLLPAYPLDGGRVFSALLTHTWGVVLAEKIRKIVSGGIVGTLFLAFVFEWKDGAFNLGLLLFCLFLGCGIFGAGGDARYEKILFDLGEGFLRGLEIKRVAVSKELLLCKSVRFLEKGKYLTLEVYGDEQEKLGEISQNRLSQLFSEADHCAKLGDFL